MLDLNQSTADVVVPKRRCSNANLTRIGAYTKRTHYILKKCGYLGVQNED